MYSKSHRGTKPKSLLDSYSQRLGVVIARNLAEQALVAAKQDAERSAVVAHSAMLKAQAADRAKLEFLANVSHELRTPLNAIIGFSDMMMHGLLGSRQVEKQLEYTKDINESGRHLLGLINDILDVAKIEAGKLELDENGFPLNDMITSCVTIVKERSQEKRQILLVDVPEASPTLFADERKLKQVLINLLSNAVKFTPEGGSIVLSWAYEPGASLDIKVFDTGIGIPVEHIATAMEPFQQIENYLSKTYEGTGLGLPLSKALMELHDGTLVIDSAVNVGTVATMLLPSARVQPGYEAEPGQPDDGEGNEDTMKDQREAT